MSPEGSRHHKHKHRSRVHHHHHSRSKNESSSPSPLKETNEQHEMILNKDSINRCQQILRDFKETYPEDTPDLITQLSILDNGYAVDVAKISNSIIQGTLRIVFDILSLPQTNRGYFWDEESFDGKRIYDLFGDCFTDSLPPPKQSETNGDSNAIDLEEEEEEEVKMGPARPPPVLSTTKDAPVIGPSIPKEVLEMMQHGIPVQIEDDGEDVGPALPGHEERKPTEQAFEQSQPEQLDPKRLKRAEWMTMMPEAGFSSAFAEVRSRRFANVPTGCTIDPSWAETPEERKKKLREYLAKTQVGGVEEEENSKNESNDDKQRKVKEYLEEYDRQYRPESLASIYKRMKSEGTLSKPQDNYSREAIFRNGKRKRSFAGDVTNSMGSLKSRFGDVKYSGGSMF